MDEENIEEIEEEDDEILDILEVLKTVSHGTILRQALDEIVKARTGALIVIDIGGLHDIIDGGFEVNADFSAEKLIELCKMDGAVILSDDLSKIKYANVMLVPSRGILTSETGTRHKAAERTAKEIKTLCVAISERRNTITLYYRDLKYNLKSAEEVLTKATQNLQILEKQRELYEQEIGNLNFLEVAGVVSVSDVCSVFQRIEVFKRISGAIIRSIVELGKEGNIMKMRLKELNRGIEKQKQFIFKDYVEDNKEEILDEIEFEGLLNPELLAEVIFNKNLDEKLIPKGHRFLDYSSFGNDKKQFLLSKFENLDNILKASKEEVLALKGVDFAEEFVKEREEVREKFIKGKNIS